MDQFEDVEVYPVEASARGDNAYYLEHCTVTHVRPGYASCLKKIADRKNGRLETAIADCSAAIGKKECPAQKLREKELKEGKALFYISRPKLRAFSQYREEMSMQRLAALTDGKSGKSKASPKPVEPPKVSSPLPDTTSDYAAAINRALAEEAKQPATPAPKPKQPAIKPAAANPAPVAGKVGMSLIELARLRFAAQAA